MTDIDALSSRLSALSSGRASAPRLREGVLTLVLDVSGLGEAERDSMVEVLTAEARQGEGVETVRIAQTAERHDLAIIAVASGKGGVGKSTVAANLAIALSRLGTRVGLVDADIYGPSQPRLLASEGHRPKAEDKRLIPVLGAGGLPMLSMGHLVEPGRAVAWRGPMAGNALGQLIDARWGDAQVLIVDMPPGTGDVQLSMVQKHKPAGVVIVSTPQDLALIDARKAISMFSQVDVEVLGLVENMSVFVCPHCGERSHIFGERGAEEEAARIGVPFLGGIPLHASIREASDAGRPPALAGTEQAQAFREIAARVAQRLNLAAGRAS